MADDAVAWDEMVAFDRWAVLRARELQAAIEADYRAYDFHAIYQRIQNFCAIDMGSRYLDIVKDRQYTTPATGLPRRSAQTAMQHIIEAMVRWLAPILSFTAEDIWLQIPGERGDSVFLETWYDFPGVGADEPSGTDWASVLAVREAVGQVLEGLRKAGEIGSSLDAEVTLYCSPRLLAALEPLGEELRFVLITSAVGIAPFEARPDGLEAVTEGLAVAARASTHDKCVRCWHHRPDIGRSTEHPEICGRCLENVAGDGEQRRFA